MRRRFSARPRQWAKAAAISAIALATIAGQAARPAHAGVMMEGFYSDCPSGYGNTWWWDNLANQSTTLAKDGFSAIWMPPAIKGNSGGYSVGYDPYDDYDLGSKNQKGTIPTHYGTRMQLERACAIMHANGLQIYADTVDNHRDGDSGNYAFSYADAYGDATGGRFGKSYYDFHPNVAQDPNVPDGSNEVSFGDDCAPVNGAVTSINGQNWVWMDYGLKQAADWETKALDLNGYRLDYVRGISWTWLYSFLNYNSMAGKFAVSENWDTDVSDLNNWVSNSMQNRSSAFDFPLRQNYLMPMCNNPGSFNMASLDHAGLAGINPGGAVTFVENHDTDSSYPITQDKLLGYAYILTSEGYPCVYYRDWSTDSGCYGSGLQTGINNLIWVHEKIASGTTQQRWENSQVFAYERLGGSHLLVGLSDDTSAAHTITCATGFGEKVDLHDYTGHEPDVYTDSSGNATITIPTDTSGASFVAYSVAGITGSFTPVAASTTQEYDGAQDLDIKPADNTKYITAAQVEVKTGTTLHAALYYDTTAWTSSTNISVHLLDPTGTQVKAMSFTSATAQGSAISWKAAATGLYTFLIRSNSTPAANLKPAYYLKTSYTAPSTIIPVTFTTTNAGTSGSQQLYVCGNDTDLGNFTPASAFLLNNDGSNTWSGEIALPASTAIQYKYVIWDGKTAIWEANQKTASGNREITTPSKGTLTENNGAF